VDDDSFLWCEIVLESGLTTPGALDLGAERQSIKFQKVKHLVSLTNRFVGDLLLEELWFQSIGDD